MPIAGVARHSEDRMHRRWGTALAAVAAISSWLATTPARPAVRPAMSGGAFPSAADTVRATGAALKETTAWPAPPANGEGLQIDDPAAGRISTVAGGSAAGAGALDSTFFQPYGAAAAGDGTLYVADTYDNQIKAIDPRSHVVSVLAGTGDAGWRGDGGPARRASFNFPMAVAVAPDGGLFVADTWNDRIRRIDPRTGGVTTVAGNGPNDATGRTCADREGPAAAAVISEPHGVATDGEGNLLIADTGCDVVEKVDPAGRIRIVAGIEARSGAGPDGPATATPIANPLSVAIDRLGNAVVADSAGRILYVDLGRTPVRLFPRGGHPLVVAPGARVTIAGTAPSTSKTGAGEALAHPDALGFSAAGDLLVADGGRRVRRIDWGTGTVTTVAGNGLDGTAPDAAPPDRSPLSYPAALFGAGGAGFVVVERGNSRLRRIEPGTPSFTVAGRPDPHGPALGDGLPGTRAQLDWPRAVATGPRGVYIADSYDLRIRRINADGSVTTVAGSGPPCVRLGVASDDCGAKGALPAHTIGTAMPLGINYGTALAGSPGALLAFVDLGQVYVLNDGSRTVTLFPRSAHPMALAPGWVQRLAGGGNHGVPETGSEPAVASALQGVTGLAFTDRHELLVTEQLADRIDRIDLTSGGISVLAGGSSPGRLDGPLPLARFHRPAGLSAGPDGAVFVADTGNNAVRKIDRARNTVTTVAGTGVAGFAGDGGPAMAAELADPTDAVVAADGSVFVVDWGNERVRRVDRDGIIRTFAGRGPSRVGRVCGSTVPCGHFAGDGGPAPSAGLYLPLDGASFAALAPGPVLYLADTTNNRVRAVAVKSPGR
jgi:sugar lactone lactonase YvrE